MVILLLTIVLLSTDIILISNAINSYIEEKRLSFIFFNIFAILNTYVLFDIYICLQHKDYFKDLL
jgi:hypothetical protein